MTCSQCHGPIYSSALGCPTCRIWQVDDADLQRQNQAAGASRPFRAVSFAPPEPVWAPEEFLADFDDDENELEVDWERTRVSVRRSATRFWVIDLPDGSCEVVVGNVVVGRAPTLDAQWLPGRALRVGGAPSSLSKSHAMFTERNGGLIVRDLMSRNGVVVSQPGRPEIDLSDGGSLLIAEDSVVELGDTVLTVRRH